MKYRSDYSLSAWLIDVRDIVASREFISKKDALLMIVEDIEEFIDMYEGGESPQSAYQEMVD